MSAHWLTRWLPKATPIRYRAPKLRVEQLEDRTMPFSNGALFGLYGPAVHEAITHNALSFLKDDILTTITNANVDQDAEFFSSVIPQHPERHFDGSMFQESAANIRGKYDSILVTDFDAVDDLTDTDIAELFGGLLHPAQDFYAHSNWVEYINAGVINAGTLVDYGSFQWGTMNPYTEIQPGVLLVEGENTTPMVPGFGTATLSRTGTTVTIAFDSGLTKYGVITGDYEGSGIFPAEPNNTPDNVAIAHGDDTVGTPTSGLNKDRPAKGALHTQAVALATAQTEHEFVRLVNLINQRYGHDAVCKLLDAWVKPDLASQNKARELAGLPIGNGTAADIVFVIDTTGSMADDIDEVKADAALIIHTIETDEPNSRIAVVLYKDAGDSYVTRTQLAFTCDADKALDAINAITVGGGGDTPEAVYAGLLHAILNQQNMGEWRGGDVAKRIILMGDAPPHDPDNATGATAASVAQAAYDADPVDIYTIVIGGDRAAQTSFQQIAAASRGQSFAAADAGEVVSALLAAISASLPQPPAPVPQPPTSAPLTPTPVRIFAVASDRGVAPLVKVYNADGSLRFGIRVHDSAFLGGVDVTTGDVTGDGVADVITGAGAGSAGGHVKVFDGMTGTEIRSFLAFPGFAGGVSVASADVTGDGIADIVVGAGAGSAGGHVKVFDGVTGAEVRSFFAFSGFRGGVQVAAGDVTGDGIADIVVGAGAGSAGGHVKVFDGVTGAEVRSFFAYGVGFVGGTTITAADIDHDGTADIITGAGPGADAHVKAFNGRTQAEILSFLAYEGGFAGGVYVDGADLDGDGVAEIITDARPGGLHHIRAFRTNSVVASFRS